MKTFSNILFFLILPVVFIFSLEYKAKIEFIPTNCSGKATVDIDGRQKEIDFSKSKKWKIKKKKISDISFHPLPSSSDCELKIKLNGKNKIELNGFNFKDLSFSSKLNLNFEKLLIYILTLCFFTLYVKQPLSPSPSSSQSTPKRFYNLDFLRLVFMGQIVYTHLSLPLKFSFSIVGYTEYFFILSGFLMFLTFNPEKSVFNFICDKIARWWPLMIWGILIRLCVKGDFEGLTFISELLFLPLTGIANVGINQPDWFLAVLFWTSVFYLLLFKAFDKNKLNLALFFMTASCALIFARGIYGIYNMQIIRGILGTGLGCFAAKLYICVNDRLRQNQKKINPFVLTILEIFVLSNVFLCKNWLFVIFSNTFLIFLFALQKGYISHFFNTEYFARPGKYVLAVFLTHGFVVNECLPLVLNAFPQIESYKATVIIISYLLVSLFGIISYNIFGKKPEVLEQIILKK